MQKLFRIIPPRSARPISSIWARLHFRGRLLGSVLACFVHGLFLFLFTSTGSGR